MLDRVQLETGGVGKESLDMARGRSHFPSTIKHFYCFMFWAILSDQTCTAIAREIILSDQTCTAIAGEPNSEYRTHRGDGVAKDFHEAIKFWLLSAKQGESL